MYIWTCLAVQKDQKCVRRRWLAIERTLAMIVMDFRTTDLTDKVPESENRQSSSRHKIVACFFSRT